MYLDIVKFIWDFLKPNLSDAIKERLKQQSSEERAKEGIFAVYRSLLEVHGRSEAFVDTLEEFANTPKKRRDPDRLSSAISALVYEMEVFQKKCSRMRIRLEVYLHHAVAKYDDDYMVPRGELLGEISCKVASDASGALVSLKRDDLQKLVKKARRNHKQLSSAMESFREFIQEQFEFKESF